MQNTNSILMAQILKEAEVITLLVTNEEYNTTLNKATDYILSFQSKRGKCAPELQPQKGTH